MHRERWERRQNGYPDIEMDPELKAAYHSLQLYWLANSPEYRETVRKRVSEAAIRAERRSHQMDKYYEDKDYLGREIEGCG